MNRRPARDTVPEVQFTDATDESLEVVVLPDVGARLHHIRVFGHDVLAGPTDIAAHSETPFSGGSYVMAPWANRVSTEPVVIGGRTLALPSNFADGTAIHGEVYATPWERRPDGTFAVRGGGSGGWPWAYEVRQRIAVHGPTLTLDFALENRSTDPMPAGLGIHPWFVRPVEVAVPAEAVYPLNTAIAAQPVPVAGETDLRAMGPMAFGLDATWTHLTRPEVELRWPALGIAATMRADAPTLCIVAARLASQAGGDATAVEPQTHAPQGIRRLINGEPDAMMLLVPGAILALRVSLAFRRL